MDNDKVGPELAGERRKEHDAVVTHTVTLTHTSQTPTAADVVADALVRANSLGLTKPADVAISVLVVLEERGLTIVRRPRGNGRK